jgi:hypothetical protein
MEKGPTALLWAGCAAIAGAIVADRYSSIVGGATTVALLVVGAASFGVFVWRELRFKG